MMKINEDLVRLSNGFLWELVFSFPKVRRATYLSFESLNTPVLPSDPSCLSPVVTSIIQADENVHQLGGDATTADCPSNTECDPEQYRGARTSKRPQGHLRETGPPSPILAPTNLDNLRTTTNLGDFKKERINKSHRGSCFSRSVRDWDQVPNQQNRRRIMQPEAIMQYSSWTEEINQVTYITTKRCRMSGHLLCLVYEGLI
jgi:hypothetical protein